ncbi:HPr kinase/phosphorylase [Blastochloris sulfoviridis]|uniref:Serine kinase n=1 Tax=Blastochloris sulfoviridis TaxID=50712 RepID=A0A5M6I258_9HYPH|nr:HPr kinase/phosphatase C-terminal domain-containing protein [Blastochloris sulfoviridis]KAA5601939.1 serine kinase [Blastochloris sulfoviridis]
MLATGRTIHASAVLVGESAVVIRGPSGSGKSRLALGLIRLAEAGGTLPFARLVGDDRVALAAASGRLLVSPAPNIAGLIEVRGLGVLPLPYEPLAVAGLIVDLAAEDGARMPAADSARTRVFGVEVARLPVAAGADPLALVAALIAGRRVPSAAALWDHHLRWGNRCGNDAGGPGDGHSSVSGGAGA